MDMYEEIRIACSEKGNLKTALEEKKYRYATEYERRILEKLMIQFVEKNGHTLSGVTTFRGKCDETEKFNRICGHNPESLFSEIRAWQNEKDFLLFEGTRRVVDEEAFRDVAEVGMKLIRIFEENEK